MRKPRTSTYLKALSLVALALYFTNCAPKGPNQQAQLKAHCLQSMDPKADFVATAESLTDNAKIRVVTADYREYTLRDDIPLKSTTMDSNIFSEKPIVEAKTEVSESLLPEKFCGTHQIKLPDGTVARISSVSDSHLEATWTGLIKNNSKSQTMESMNSVTYRYVIDPETKVEHLEITNMSLYENHKKLVKKDIYIGEELSKEVKMNASVLQALSAQVSPDFIKSLITVPDDVVNALPKIKKLKQEKSEKLQKLTLTPKQMDDLQNNYKNEKQNITPNVLEVDSQAVMQIDLKNIMKLQGFINTADQRVKINERAVDIDSAEVRDGDPSVDQSIYQIEASNEPITSQKSDVSTEEVKTTEK